MLILGINDTHDASACIIKDGVLLVAAAEERFRRVKMIGSYPEKAIEHVLKFSGYTSSDLDHVAVATKSLPGSALWNTVADFSIKDWLKLQEEFFYNKIYKKKNISFRSVFPKYKPSIKLGYPINKIKLELNSDTIKKNSKSIKSLREQYISNFLKVDKKIIKFYDHHLCHGLYAYFVFAKEIKNKKVALVTLDSGGDNTYNCVSTIHKGRLKLVSNETKSLIGQIYESVTLILGMNPAKHLYKVMGLAPYAADHHKKGPRNIFLESFSIKGIKFHRNPKMVDYFTYFKKKLNHYRFDGIAGGVQDFVEIRLVQWFKNISKKTKCNHFIFSGGVANNVKANKVLSEQKFVKSLYVPPGPGDENLSIGAAYAAMVSKLGLEKTTKLAKKIHNAYWGPKLEDKEIDKFKNNSFIKKNFTEIKDKNFNKTSAILAKGEILFFCYGRMEFGQRALGHRSILCDPSKFESIKKINTTIKKRDFWMPFTPSILKKFEKKYIVNPKNISSNFMTTCYDTTEIGKDHLRAAIHPYDFTARPQIVTKKTCPVYYELIEKFYKKTGIGGLLNTSLNIHDKPIVCQPLDIVNEILKNNNKAINYIYIQDTLYQRKIKKS
jgi:carbamoyltransferase